MGRCPQVRRDGELTRDRQTPPCVIAKRNCQRIARRLMLLDWRRVGYFVAAVWKNGNAGREKTMADFGIGERQYQRRCALYARLEVLKRRFSGRC